MITSEFVHILINLCLLRLNSSHQHVTDQLFGYFFQHLLAQIPRAHALHILYELDDVAFGNLPTPAAQDSIVAVKFLHLSEISVADSNDYNGYG